MSVLSVIVAIGLFLIALLWLGVGIAGLRGRIARNRWVGVRAEETLASEEAFTVANRVAAPGTLGAAVILICGGLLTIGVEGGWSILFGLGSLIATLVLVGVVSGYGVRAARLVPVEEHSCGCCSSDSAPAATEPAASSTPADDCGESSCASCTLRGVCATDASTSAEGVRAHSSQA